jgi:hypothetical protein
MLRELHEVLTELQTSVAPLADARQAGVRIATLDMSLPVDIVAILRNGGCVLLADVQRNHADANWCEEPTRLHVVLSATPVAHDLSEVLP